MHTIGLALSTLAIIFKPLGRVKSIAGITDREYLLIY
jgi:hypothetical protein